MCLHVQYLSNPEFNRLYQRGFTQVVIGGNSEPRPLYGFEIVTRENKYGKKELNYRVPFSYYKCVEDNSLVASARERLNNRHYYKVYNNDESFYKDSLLLNPSTGEVRPLMTSVNCGVCPVCRDKISTRTVARAKLHSSKYGSPFFCLFTIRPEDYHLFDFENNRKGVVRELQLFFKRLRENLKNDGYNVKLKYILVSEFGSKRNRLHFHALIWLHDCDYSVIQELQELREYTSDKGKVFFAPRIHLYLQSSWRYGYCSTQLSKDSSGKYVAKYLSKTFYGQSPIKLQSKKLGSEVIEESKDYIRNNPFVETFPYVDFDGRPQFMRIYSFIARQVMPSFARSIPKELRDSVTVLLDLLPKYYKADEWCRFAWKMVYKYAKPYIQAGYFTYSPFSKLTSLPLSYDWSYLAENFALFLQHMHKFPGNPEYVIESDVLNSQRVEYMISNISFSDSLIRLHYINKKNSIARYFENDEQ